MNRPQQVIGRCPKCRHFSWGDDPSMAECAKRQGRINTTFVHSYHDCFEPVPVRQTVLGGEESP